MYKDLVQFHQEKHCCTRWSFDARAEGLGVAGIKKIIMDEVRGNAAVQKALRKDLKIRENDFGKFLKKIESEMDGFIEVGDV